jgi:hypothetical protein
MTLKPIDYGIAHAVAWDAGTRSMRAAGRETWGEEDLAVATTAEMERLLGTATRILAPKPLLTLEEFAYHCEWSEVIRLSQFVWEGEVRKMAIKKIREFKRGREVFQGPYGETSQWARMVQRWYVDYLRTGEL